MSILTQEFVFAALDAEKAGKQFSIDFDDVWQALGYTRKDNAIANLKEWLQEKIDWVVFLKKEENSEGRPRNIYKLSVEAFKMFCMMARTEQGRETRRYFIEIEKAYLAQLQRQFDAPPAPKDVKRSGIRFSIKRDNQLKKAHKEIANLRQTIQMLTQVLEAKEINESPLLENLESVLDFNYSIQEIIKILNPLPTSSYSAKYSWILSIIIRDGIPNEDWVRTGLGVRVNLRFVVGLALCYRGKIGTNLELLPKTIIMNPVWLFKKIEAIDKKINTRFPKQSDSDRR